MEIVDNKMVMGVDVKLIGISGGTLSSSNGGASEGLTVSVCENAGYRTVKPAGE